MAVRLSTFPVTHGNWNWGPLIALTLLATIIGLVGALKNRLEDESWWHTIAVAAATLTIGEF